MIGTRWRHLRRGGTYIVIAEARLQCSDRKLDMSDVVVYRAEHDDHSTWVRPKDEFLDGRFVQDRSQKIDQGAGL